MRKTAAEPWSSEQDTSSARKEKAEWSWRLGLGTVERDPMQGKEVPGGPERSLGLRSQGFLRARASHRPQGGALTRWCTFGPMESPFPGRHGQGVQGFSLLLKTGEGRERNQGLTSGSTAFPVVTALPAPQLEGDRPSAAWCLSHPHFPRPPSERSARQDFQACLRSRGVRPGLHPPKWRRGGRLGRPVA